jgi:hypothetical protein
MKAYLKKKKVYLLLWFIIKRHDNWNIIKHLFKIRIGKKIVNQFNSFIDEMVITE